MSILLIMIKTAITVYWWVAGVDKRSNTCNSIVGPGHLFHQDYPRLLAARNWSFTDLPVWASFTQTISFLNPYWTAAFLALKTKPSTITLPFNHLCVISLGKICIPDKLPVCGPYFQEAVPRKADEGTCDSHTLNFVTVT